MREQIKFKYLQRFGMSLIILILVAHKQLQAVRCQVNSNCFSGCAQSYCQYDPSTNSFYNSSLAITSPGYQGHGCCIGCNIGFYYFPQNKTCYKGNCYNQPYVDSIIAYWDYYLNLCLPMCRNYISSQYFILVSQRKCVKECPTLKVSLYYFYTNQRYCIQRCPQPYYYNIYDPNSCSLNCIVWEIGLQQNYQLYKSAFLGSCVRIYDCPFDSNKGLQTYANNLTMKCTQKCPDASYAYPQRNVCMQYCYGKYPYKNMITNFCVRTRQQQVIVAQYVTKQNQNYQLISDRKYIDFNIFLIGMIITFLAAVIVTFSVIFLCRKCLQNKRISNANIKREEISNNIQISLSNKGIQIQGNKVQKMKRFPGTQQINERHNSLAQISYSGNIETIQFPAESSYFNVFHQNIKTNRPQSHLNLANVMQTSTCKILENSGQEIPLTQIICLQDIHLTQNQVQLSDLS